MACDDDTITEQPVGLPELKIEILETSVPGPSGNTSGKWEASLCSCLTSPCSNCKTMFCCCCILKQVANHLGKSGCLWCCCLWPFTPLLRGALRRAHGIKGNCCYDCLVFYFCTCCAMVQMDQERKKGEIIRNDEN